MATGSRMSEVKASKNRTQLGGNKKVNVTPGSLKGNLSSKLMRRKSERKSKANDERKSERKSKATDEVHI